MAVPEDGEEACGCPWGQGTWLSVEGGGMWLSLGMGWWHVAVLKAEWL